MRVTGTPIRPEIVALGSLPRPPLGARPVRVLVTGSSLGDGFLNDHVPSLLIAVANAVPLEVLHQTGLSDPAPLAAIYQRAGLNART
ncbi:MAG TPA: hypothetical protein VEB21_04090, partial [Terriglobales bacterium]|nr:hypothetical protein [Terriglobales bacterium]